MALALKGMTYAGANVPINPDEFVRKLRDTDRDAFLMSLSDVEEELSYSQWKRVELADGKKTTLVVEKKLKKEEFVTVARKEISELLEHIHRVITQYAKVNTPKENLPQGHIILHMDFAENFIFYSVDEVQSAYWNNIAVTLHHIVAYFKDQCTERSTYTQKLRL